MKNLKLSGLEPGGKRTVIEDGGFRIGEGLGLKGLKILEKARRGPAFPW